MKFRLNSSITQSPITRSLCLLAVLAMVACRGGDTGSDGGADDSGNTTKDSTVNGDGQIQNDGTATDFSSSDGSSNAVETTVQKIKSGEVVKGTLVRLNDVVVTSVDIFGDFKGDMYVQEAAGGAWSGIKLFRPIRDDGGQLGDLKAGDHVRVEGEVDHFSPKSTPFPDGRVVIEISNAKVKFLNAGTAPQPAAITYEQLSKPTDADQYEGVLVKLSQVQILGGLDQYGQFKVTRCIDIDDDLYQHTPQVGQCVDVTGILVYFYGHRINPRGASDIATGTCPTASTTTISAIQSGSGSIAENTLVTVEGVVTAIDAAPNAGGEYFGVWIQDPASAQEYGGIYVSFPWTQSSAVQPPTEGTKVSVTGMYRESFDASALTCVMFQNKGTGTITPIDVAATDISTANKTTAEKYEGMLVKIGASTVDKNVTTTSGTVVGVQLKGSNLIIDRELFDFITTLNVQPNDEFKSITGVLHYSFSNFRLLPRKQGDLVK